MSFASMSALALRAGYRARAFSPVEVVAELADRIERVEPSLNAFVTLALDRATEEAAASEREYGRGGDRALLGVPFAAKDLVDSAGVRTTYGSSMFSTHVPSSDADAVARMRRAGAILVGKTATHEFGWGITTANPHYGPTRNPWAADRIPGGSSGGSAAALAARLVPVALGTDTGGSVRIPAGFCGVVGLKPTYGGIDTGGQFPLAPSFDHAGVMTRTPGDALLVLDVLGGPSAESVGTPLRLGICPDLHRVALAPDVARAFTEAASTLERLGAEIVEVSLPGARDAYEAFAAIQLAEGRDVHRRFGLYPRRREEYGADVRERLELAERVGADDRHAAMDERRAFTEAFESLFLRVDLLLTPTAAIAAPPVGSDPILHRGASLPLRELVMTYTAPQNLTGLPACALRAGFSDDGLPIGVQLTGPRHSDAFVLRVADRLFEATPATQAPEPSAG